MQYTTLSNGVKMPLVGYGVFLISNEETERCVLDAIRAGYRSIDTAQAYWNEEGVGNAIVKSGVPRDELFITTKVWVSHSDYEKTKASIDESLRKLQTDYVDLLLVHQPFGDSYGRWRAVEEAYQSGKARAIGVSNFYGERFVDLAHFAQIKPMVNQVEAHIFSQRQELRPYVEKHGAKLIAWSPLAQGKNGIFTHLVLSQIGQQYGKTASQIALKFLVQQGITVIPKSERFERMQQNIALFDFELSDDDMAQIIALDTGENLIYDHQNPANVEQFFERFGL